MRTQVIAHRGASDRAPENTLSAFTLAWELDADGIECDIHLTRDNRIVCIHDDTTWRTAGSDQWIAKSTFAELRRLDVGLWKGGAWRGERIPELAEVLRSVPAGKRVFVEIKSGVQMIDVLEREIQDRDVTIISFQEDVIAACKQRMPDTPALWLVDSSRRTINKILRTLDRIGADGVDMNVKDVDAGCVAALRAAGREVHVYTVNDPEKARVLRELKVNSITTDRVGEI